MEHIHTTRDACTTTPRVTPTVQTPTVQTPTSTDGTNTDGTRPQVQVCSASRVRAYSCTVYGTRAALTAVRVPGMTDGCVPSTVLSMGVDARV